MKRIFCFIDSLGSGGAQRQLVGLASFLKDHGYETTVVCYYEDLFYLDLLKSNNVSYVFLQKAQNATFRLWYVSCYFRKTKPDIVIAYLETPSICACFAKLFNRKFKLIVSERSTTQHTGIKERIRFNLFRLADFVVPNAYSQENYIKTVFPKLANKTFTIPNFVDLEQFVPPTKRNRRKVPEIMIAASIWPLKNTMGLIDAVAKLKEKGCRFHISWYGKSIVNLDYFNDCQQMIKQCGVEDSITLKEKTNRIKECYQDADFFCLPSFYEGTPNVICEAMACGLPVVCSDVCDNSKYVLEGENGFLFDPKDTDSIVTAFEQLFALSNEEYESFCCHSRTLAEQKLSRETFVKEYIKLIKQ